MRVELRVELDAHEHAVTVETDQSVPLDQVLDTAVGAINELTRVSEGGI